MIANMGLNVIFVAPLYIMEFKGAHTGLALATATSAYLNAWLLLRELRKAGHYKPQSGWLKLFAQIGFACIAMGGVLYWNNPPLEVWIDWDIWTRILNLSLWIGIGFITYIAALLISGLKPKTFLPSNF